MAKSDTFFLRDTVTSSGTDYVSSNIDITGYVDVPRGRVLVVDNAYITFSTDAGGPIIPTDLAASGTAGKQMGAQACSEIQTGLVQMSNNSLLTRTNLYVSMATAGILTLAEQTDALNPTTFMNGFIIPTNQLHVGIDTSYAWNGEITVGFLFEVHTEKLSLQRIQELLVSLTAN